MSHLSRQWLNVLRQLSVPGSNDADVLGNLDVRGNLRGIRDLDGLSRCPFWRFGWIIR